MSLKGAQTHISKAVTSWPGVTVSLIVSLAPFARTGAVAWSM